MLVLGLENRKTTLPGSRDKDAGTLADCFYPQERVSVPRNWLLETSRPVSDRKAR